MAHNNAQKILQWLITHYPRVRTALHYSNPWEIVVATILSAQCTDKRVNSVTKALFKKYKTINDYAQAKTSTFESDIRSTGFFRNKARNIISAAQKILLDFHGGVPATMNELVTIPGVARKTANVVLYNAFDKNEGVAVDTHVRRLSQRLGLSNHDRPEKIEQDLMHIYPREKWGILTHVLIEHGRALCAARKPKCVLCGIRSYCPAFKRIYFKKV